MLHLLHCINVLAAYRFSTQSVIALMYLLRIGLVLSLSLR